MGAISPRSCLLLSLLAGDRLRYGLLLRVPPCLCYVRQVVGNSAMRGWEYPPSTLTGAQKCRESEQDTRNDLLECVIVGKPCRLSL